MKKNLKKVMSIVCAGAMMLSLAACSGSSSTSTETTASTQAESTSKAADASSQDESSKGLKICIISSSGIDDGSFNQNCYEGILEFVESHPDCTVTDVKEEDINQMVTKTSDLSGQYDVFVLPGYNFASVGDVVKDNPDKYFIVVDSTVTDAEGNPVSGLDNLYTMTFSEQQGGFFAGVAAALSTKTNKVAVINGLAYPSNVNYQYGFESGVNYANAHYDTNVECVELASYAGTDIQGNDVGGNYAGSFADEATGKVIGESLIDAGCDIMFIAAGATGNGTFTAIKEKEGTYAIGCDVDQYDDGVNGSSNIMLTSALKVMDKNVKKQLENIYNGTFVGEDAYLGADTDSVGYVSEEGRQQLSSDALDKLAKCYELVKDGTIVPAADATVNDYTPEDFPGLK